jgi:hypothetical protein
MSLGVGKWLQFLLCFLGHVGVFWWVIWVVGAHAHPFAKGNAYKS